MSSAALQKRQPLPPDADLVDAEELLEERHQPGLEIHRVAIGQSHGVGLGGAQKNPKPTCRWRALQGRRPSDQRIDRVDRHVADAVHCRPGSNSSSEE